MGLRAICGVLAGLALLAPAHSLGQDAGKPHTRTVLVVVHDKHGKPMAAVNKSDLEVQADSKPAAITQVVSAASQPLLLGLVIDTSKPQEQVLPAEKAPEKAFLGSTVATHGNQAFVIHFDRQIELMQDLTAAPAQLNSGVDDLQPAGDEAASDSGSGSADDEGHAEHSRPPPARLYDAVFLAADEVLKKPEGRKALVVVSSGIDHGSKESFASAVEAAQRGGVAVYTIYVAGEQPKPENERGGNNQGGQRRSGGGWPGGGGDWPGSPGGGAPGGGQTGGRQKRETLPHEDGRKILLELSQKTGGAMFESKKKDELPGLLSDISEYLQDEYSVTFELDPQMTGDFHRLAISAHAGGEKVQAPQAFYTSH